MRDGVSLDSYSVMVLLLHLLHSFIVLSYPSVQSEVATAVSNVHRPCVEMFKTQEKPDISVN